MIKLIATDIDGTLLKEGTPYLNEKYLPVFHKLIDSGVKVLIASGRNITEVYAMFDGLKDKIYVASNNGAVLEKGKKIYYIKAIGRENCKRIIKDIQEDPYHKNNAVLASTKDHGVIVSERDRHMVNYLQQHYRTACEIVKNFDPFLDEILKINIFDNNGTSDETVQRTKETYGDEFAVYKSGVFWTDICNKEATKGNAVTFLQRKFNISFDETLVMGDNNNDLSMLKKGKYSFAPEDSADYIKQQTKYVMHSYDKFGGLEILNLVLKHNNK